MSTSLYQLPVPSDGLRPSRRGRNDMVVSLSRPRIPRWYKNTLMNHQLDTFGYRGGIPISTVIQSLLTLQVTRGRVVLASSESQFHPRPVAEATTEGEMGHSLSNVRLRGRSPHLSTMLQSRSHCARNDALARKSLLGCYCPPTEFIKQPNSGSLLPKPVTN